MAEHRIYSMAFSKVYPMYVDKAERKDRTKAEVDEVIRWLTGYDKAGLDAQMTLDVLTTSAASSRMLEVRGPMMVEQHYEPATMKNDVWRKDIELISAFARDLDCPAPLFSITDALYSSTRGRGSTWARSMSGLWSTSSAARWRCDRTVVWTRRPAVYASSPNASSMSARTISAA